MKKLTQLTSGAARLACIALAMWLTAAPALAQDYPSRPITIVVATAAGGTTDMVARLLGEKLLKRWGQPVIIDNRPGAGNIIGTSYVAKAKPDGYTLLLGSSSPMSVNPAIYPKLPYDAEKDLQPISLLAFVRLMIVSNPKLPIRNFPEMVAYSKAHPGQMSYATPGNGTTHHLVGEMLKVATGLDMRMIPYRGSAPALTDVIAGRVPFMIDNLNTALPQVRGGNLTAIAVTSAERVKIASDIPTVAESGLPGFDINAWVALVGPSGMPKDVVSKLSAAMNDILKEPDVEAKFSQAGLDIDGGSPEKLTALVHAEITRYRDLIKKTNIKIE